jgi:hypothetical protein
MAIFRVLTPEAIVPQASSGVIRSRLDAFVEKAARLHATKPRETVKIGEGNFPTVPGHTRRRLSAGSRDLAFDDGFKAGPAYPPCIVEHGKLLQGDSPAIREDTVLLQDSGQVFLLKQLPELQDNRPNLSLGGIFHELSQLDFHVLLERDLHRCFDR